MVLEFYQMLDSENFCNLFLIFVFIYLLKILYISLEFHHTSLLKTSVEMYVVTKSSLYFLLCVITFLFTGKHIAFQIINSSNIMKNTNKILYN